MDIKEIALNETKRMQAEGWAIGDSSGVVLVERVIAELAKQNEPVAFTNSAQLGYVTSGQHQDIPLAMWSRNTSYSGADIPLYTIPPTAEQIANETAEACAKYVNRFLNGDGIQDEAWIRDIESGIRRGAWKEFKNV